ncbi:S-layer protein precursor [Thermococcus onnurineus NA1]|uniref:S-layer protein n=1 Tax=Thermococcus onnurineus (strain NA1) TaxID=523850 RepID=B6YTL1_THEON|nr:S-layer protein [Thermococcus onnurineus]ACJ15898.1 S-layer protein precursor [Thermococcus onnurineus NA1]
MKVKKIAALAVGAAMVGATVGFASAQPTVPEIPKDFFVNADGTPNVKIVVGSNAAAMDVASAADIAVALGSLLYTTEQVEAQNAYVKIKAEYPPATLDEWTIYAYNFTTITEDHGITNITSWATSYDELPGDYWWNGAAYAGTYTDWVSNFMVTTDIDDKDMIDGVDELIDWHITIQNVQLSSKDPAEWDGTMPPKDADLVITPGNVTVLVDYVLYNYTTSTTVEVSPAYPEWGIDATYDTVESWYLDDAEDGGTLADPNPVVKGVTVGDTFSVFGQTYYVLDVNNGTFTAGLDKGKAWYQVGQPQAIEGTDWIVTVLDISIIDQRALVVVKNAVTGEESGQIILEVPSELWDGETWDENYAVDVFGDGRVKLLLTDTFVGIDGHLIASIWAQVDVVDYTNDATVVYDGKEWSMTINTYYDNNDEAWYITNITLTNRDTLEGNPVDIFGTYDLKYWFEIKEHDAYYNPANDSIVQAPEGTTYKVAYAYIALTEKEGTVSEIELSVGDNVLDTEYYVAGIYADQVMVKPVASPITVMDYEVNLEDPGSNLILVGGPVANSVTQYLVEQGISQVDWYNSPGDIEYIQDALGGYDVVIVAGATRDETKAAAEALMEYLAGL